MIPFASMTLEMSSKLTELTGYSPVLCGSGVFSQLGSPWSMASLGKFDPHQTYDGYKAVGILDPPCSEFLIKGKECFQNVKHRSSKCNYSFVGKKAC